MYRRCLQNKALKVPEKIISDISIHFKDVSSPFKQGDTLILCLCMASLFTENLLSTRPFRVLKKIIKGMSEITVNSIWKLKSSQNRIKQRVKQYGGTRNK